MTRPALAVLAAVLLAPAAAAQGVPADGTEILRGLLKYQNLQPVRHTRDTTPAATLVVIVGKPPTNAATVNWVRDWVLAAGGALLVITDEPFDLTDYLPNGDGDRNTRVTGREYVCQNRGKCFRGDPHVPFLLTMGMPEFQGPIPLPRVAAPRPRAVEFPPQDACVGRPIVVPPNGSAFVDGGELDGPHAIGVASDRRFRDRVLVFGSRGLFSNGMMTASDDAGRTDNFPFAFLVTKFLAAGLNRPRGQRGYCLFIEDDRVVTDFDAVSFAKAPPQLPPGGIPPLPPQMWPRLADAAGEVANKILADAEDRDLPHALIAKDPNDRVREGWLSGLAVIGSIVLARYLLARGWGLRHTGDRTPRLRIDPDRGGGLVPERRLALLQSGNLYDPLRDHLRFVFAKFGVTAPDPGQLPNIVVDRRSRPIERIVADLRRLWFIAYVPERVTITPDDLEEFEDMIADLAQAHGRGIWRFGEGTA